MQVCNGILDLIGVEGIYRKYAKRHYQGFEVYRSCYECLGAFITVFLEKRTCVEQCEVVRHAVAFFVVDLEMNIRISKSC